MSVFNLDNYITSLESIYDEYEMTQENIFRLARTAERAVDTNDTLAIRMCQMSLEALRESIGPSYFNSDFSLESDDSGRSLLRRIADSTKANIRKFVESISLLFDSTRKKTLMRTIRNLESSTGDLSDSDKIIDDRNLAEKLNILGTTPTNYIQTVLPLNNVIVRTNDAVINATKDHHLIDSIIESSKMRDSEDIVKMIEKISRTVINTKGLHDYVSMKELKRVYPGNHAFFMDHVFPAPQRLIALKAYDKTTDAAVAKAREAYLTEVAMVKKTSLNYNGIINSKVSLLKRADVQKAISLTEQIISSAIDLINAYKQANYNMAEITAWMCDEIVGTMKIEDVFSDGRGYTREVVSHLADEPSRAFLIATGALFEHPLYNIHKGSKVLSKLAFTQAGLLLKLCDTSIRRFS